jgi:hypothetical protein
MPHTPLARASRLALAPSDVRAFVFLTRTILATLPLAATNAHADDMIAARDAIACREQADHKRLSDLVAQGNREKFADLAATFMVMGRCERLKPGERLNVTIAGMSTVKVRRLGEQVELYTYREAACAACCRGRGALLSSASTVRQTQHEGRGPSDIGR